MNANQQKLIDRVEKLLALSRANSNQAEAEAAMLKAQELIQQYNLEGLLDFKTQSSQPTNRFAHQVFDPKVGRWQPVEWKLSLFNSLCKYNYCLCYITTDGKQNYFGAFGLQDHLENVWWLYQQIVPQCEALATNYVETVKRYSSTHPLRIRNGFLVGLVSGLRARFASQSNQINSASTTAIALHTNQLQEFMNDTLGKTIKRTAPAVTAEAFHAGKASADRVGINRELPSSPVKQLKG